MRDLKIAIGNSRQARFWSNKTMSFEDICDRLKTPMRTTETARSMQASKASVTRSRDKGGFVGGHLRTTFARLETWSAASLDTGPGQCNT